MHGHFSVTIYMCPGHMEVVVVAQRSERVVRKSASKALKLLVAGHEEVARLLLEAGTQCNEFTFDGDRCHYAALTPAIRTLLRQYEQRPPPLAPLAAALRPLAPADGGAGAALLPAGYAPQIRTSVLYSDRNEGRSV